MRININRWWTILCITLLPYPLAFATQYSLPSTDQNVIGEINFKTAAQGETLLSIGEKNNIGVNAMLNANPGYNETSPLPIGTKVKIPARFVLPSGIRRGVVINLPEMRMYYFPEEGKEVMTFPIGIGKVGKTVPVTHTSIVRKKINPSWTPPDSIREFQREQGVELPKTMAPGPDNPLGPYAIYLGVPTYLMHSTIFPESIGKRASFGCIRMHENDIKTFFPSIQPGTRVDIINMPTKIAWFNNTLFLESHPPLEEHDDGGISAIVQDIENTKSKHQVTLINWPAVAYLAEQRDGTPHEIGFKAN